MIGVDWGTQLLPRLPHGPGRVRARQEDAPQGILTVPEGGFPAALEAQIGPWLDAGERHVLCCGMVGSRQGWVEAPYLRCPAGATEIATATIPLPFTRAEARLVPGLITEDAAGVPDVMRGEETKLLALATFLGDGPARVLLPGTHTKWATLQGRRIAGFTTHMTGETYAALSRHTILARTGREGPVLPAAFSRGLARARQPGGLLHHLFGVRTLHLTGRLEEEETLSFLSGLLIGHEVAAMTAGGPVAGEVHLAAAPTLASLYARALDEAGIPHRLHDPDLVAAGLAQIARSLSWL
jgi:2-dehydro-3-deoxygalactonokinase